MPAAILRHSLHWRYETECLAGRKVNNGEHPTGFQSSEEAQVNFSWMGEMKVYVACEDRIATFGRKIGVGFAGLDDGDIRQPSLGGPRFDVG